ncbi:DUF397 domain-containing protein [Streptomyces sp. NPDC093109]|uniref:DUF397 domain-containing protein n=1 Tax=Streptomyces sp. NPDC093109 TaxID=3154977 RepID=UPI00344E81F8
MAAVPDMHRFRKSSHSDSTGECVEVALNIAHTVAVRDSKTHPAGPTLLLTPTAWRTFHTALQADSPSVERYVNKS